VVVRDWAADLVGGAVTQTFEQKMTMSFPPYPSPPFVPVVCVFINEFCIKIYNSSSISPTKWRHQRGWVCSCVCVWDR